MVHFIAEVGKPRLSSAELGAHGEGLIEVHMGRVRRESQGIQDEHVDAFERGNGLCVEGLAVADVAEPLASRDLEMKANRFDFPVVDWKWDNLTFAQPKGAADLMWRWLDIASIAILTIERVGEHALQIIQTRLGRVQREVHIAEGEPPEVIESNHVIHV